MRSEAQYNLSPGVDLVTAQYLTDSSMVREYERLRDASFRSESIFEQLWRIPKFRRRVLEFTRLTIFGLTLWAGIAIISQMGLWYDIHFWIVNAL
jgi:hypothetical protein